MRLQIILKGKKKTNEKAKSCRRRKLTRSRRRKNRIGGKGQEGRSWQETRIRDDVERREKTDGDKNWKSKTKQKYYEGIYVLYVKRS